ncbi:uncharacterized protein PG998_011102 [Apiospora kogelbergensis]|uniref:Luciferase domain-containing protein n=1 Tax=Apiospora kogelbergensis TaxID=1337665 RepID=A0AAW0RCW7_9PEZI
MSLNWKLDSISLPRDRRVLAGVGAVSLGVVPLLSYAIYSYRRWLELGPGGVPYDVRGWLANVVARPFARFDLRAIAPYTVEDTEPMYGGSLRHGSFFSKVAGEDGLPPLPPARPGARPDVPTFVVPQRQMTEQASQAILAKQEAFIAAVAAANASLLRLEPSALEGRTHDALWLAARDDEDIGGESGDDRRFPAPLRRTQGEFLHPHREGSSHAIFSLADATRLIELGWAERHPLTGSKMRMGLPWSYVLIYAPRNDSELAVWMDIVMAAVHFVALASQYTVDVETPSKEGFCGFKVVS